MWPKSISAFFGALILSISIMLSLFLLIPLATAMKLLIGLISGFFIWVGLMVYYFSFNNGKDSGIACIKLLMVAIAVNSLLFLAK